MSHRRRFVRIAAIPFLALGLAAVPAFADPAPVAADAPPADATSSRPADAAPDKRELSDAEKAEIRAAIPRLKPFRAKSKNRDLAVALASR